jgi:phosphoglycerate dehydrogenase-like enzyme
MTKVVFLGRLAKEDVSKAIQAIPGVQLFVSEDLSEVLREMQGAEVLVTADVRGDESKALADALKAPARTVRFVQCVSAGYEGLVRHGWPDIPLANQGGSVAPAVAEHAFALMLGILRRVPECVLAKERHEWIQGLTATTAALEGRTLAVIGFGNIGRQVAKRARAFDMQVIAVSSSGKPRPDAAGLFDEIHPASGLHSVLPRAGAIVLTAPQTPETRHLIGAKELALCRRDAILINVSRGGLIDPAALREALQKGTIRAAGLDVTEPEPLPQDDPLWDCPNLVITAHVAGGGSPKSRGRIVEVIVGNIKRFQAGQALEHVVAGKKTA